jgi:hypothetical protein
LNREESAMTDAQLDGVYTALCTTMTRLGEANAPLFLARFALLAVEHIDDTTALQRMIEAAAQDLSTPP